MTDLTPKQIEIQHRGRQILAFGFQLMEEGGLDAIRLEDIADLVGCTRGTLYNHFRNREEMLVAMADEAIQHRFALFQMAHELSSSSREKMMSICYASMIYADDMPLDFAIEQAIRNETIWKKTSDERKEVVRENELACMKMSSACVKHAIEQKELPLPAGLSVSQMIERVCFGQWTLAHGGLIIESSSGQLAEIGIRSVRAAIHHNCNALLDSYGWQPLYDPISYEALLELLGGPLREKAKAYLRNRKSDLEPLDRSTIEAAAENTDSKRPSRSTGAKSTGPKSASTSKPKKESKRKSFQQKR